MRVSNWLGLSIAITAEVAATLSLKASVDRPLFYVVVVGGYIIAFAALAAILKSGMNLGVAYGIWGASGVALTAALSSVIFGEALTVLMGAGILAIIAGVLLVELGSRHDTRS